MPSNESKSTIPVPSVPKEAWNEVNQAMSRAYNKPASPPKVSGGSTAMTHEQIREGSREHWDPSFRK